MITKYVEYDVICDSCDADGAQDSAWYWQEQTYENYGRYPLQGCRSKREIKRLAKSEGWVFKREDGKTKHYCPKCIALQKRR
jgi:hypothetical protein